MEKSIDWNDFEQWLRDMAVGSSNKNSCSDEESDKEYFTRLANECGNMEMTFELAIWYDNGNYRLPAETEKIINMNSVTWGKRTWIQFLELMREKAEEDKVVNITFTQEELEKLISFLEKNNNRGLI